MSALEVVGLSESCTDEIPNSLIFFHSLPLEIRHAQGSKGKKHLRMLSVDPKVVFVTSFDRLFLVAAISKPKKQDGRKAVLSQLFCERAEACWEWSLGNTNIQSVSATLAQSLKAVSEK